MTGDDWVPAPWITSDEGAVRHLSAAYKLPYEDSLLALVSSVRERGSRERAEGWTTKDFMVRREKARDAIRAISDAARIASNAIDRLRHLIVAFGDQYEFEPNLMQQIAAVGPGSEWLAAEELQ